MVDTPTQKPRRLWQVIFALSLAMNVAVVGVVVGLGAREKGRGMSPRGFDMALGPIGRALDHEDRRAIGDMLRNDPALRGGGREQSREIIDSFVEVLRSSPFVEDDLAAVVVSANSRADRVQDAARAALVKRISDMTDADRAALADRIAERRRPRG